jgi:two-component system, OmpR family, sensor kinase
MSRVEFLRGDPVAPVDPPPAPPSDIPVAQGAAATRASRLGPRSLTSKLVLGVVSLVVVLVLAVSAGTYFFLKSFLGDKLDQQLQSTVNQGLLYRAFGSDQRDAGRAVDVYLTALDPSTGAVLAQPTNTDAGLAQISLSAQQRQKLAQRQSTDPLTIRTSSGRELRVTVRAAALTLPGSAEQPAAIVVGLSTQDELDTLHRLVYLEALIGGAAVIVALLATSYGVRFSLRHLRRVTTTAQEVAAELSPEGAGLDRRVPDDEPETEVGQLATSFNTMLAAVETQFAARVESETRMRQFMADASHELRTPLTSIRGYAELARMQRAAGDTLDDNLDRIESEGTRMSRLIEDLLLLARGDAEGADRPARRELLEIEDVVDDSVRGSRAAFAERQIDMAVHGAPQVLGDRDQLVRVIRNLVNNAAVHTAPERPILVRAWGDEDNVTIQIVDGGPGLSPEDAAHVFERFWRADKARTRARGGSGLGLSIVATIVRAHGGTVRFDSTVETGSTVTVTLPAARAAAD